MKSITEIIKRIIELRNERQITLLAVCPNSVAVLEAAVKVAAENNAPMLFAATLNQVDRDGGYTGWTPSQFVQKMHEFAQKYSWEGPLYPCLDHGGPWLKDQHSLDGLSLEESLKEVKISLSACLEAGYSLLHIDPTVDRSLPQDQTISVDTVVSRTIELIAHAERERKRFRISPISYEVGTEEVHGGLVDIIQFETFLDRLKAGLESEGLGDAWPNFIVTQVGTDLHTTYFDSSVAKQLYEIVSPLNSLIKGHYTDWVVNPEAYPTSGIGGANVGPEFTAEEYHALRDLCMKEKELCRNHTKIQASNFIKVLEHAVVASGRWKKWLQPGEKGFSYQELKPERRDWLVETGARYVWAAPQVKAARENLYDNLSLVLPNPNDIVVERIARKIDRYIVSFNLFDSLTIL